MKKGFITGIVTGTVVSAALMSMYIGQNPREAVRMGKRINQNMRKLFDKTDMF